MRSESRASSRWHSTALPGRNEVSKNAAAPRAQAAGFEQAAFVVEHDSLVEIDQPRPNEIFFANELGPGLRRTVRAQRRALPSWLSAMASFAWHFASS